MKILIGTDLSKGSVPAARFGFRFADRLKMIGADADVTVAHSVHSPYPKLFANRPNLEDPEERRKLENRVKSWLRTSIDREEIDYDVDLREGRADDQLVAAAEDVEADWLAVGVAGRGKLARLVIGSTAERLGHNPPCNLAICHPRGIDWDKNPRLVVGIDFTRTSGHALEEAARLAHQIDGRLDLLHVVAPPSYESYPFDTFGAADAEIQSMDQLVDRMREELEKFVEKYEEPLEGIEWSSHVLTGYPTEEVVGWAEDNDADGIVMGAAGRSAVADFLMGSITRGVVKHMPCSVFLTPPV